MGSELSVLSRVSLPEQIAFMMRKEIFKGVYQPGDKLPSERDLAERLGTSRLTLRKALGVLAQEGWIEISQGRNIVVNDFRTSVGVEVMPDLVFACPEAVADPKLLETIAENTSRLSEQILVAAAGKAKPSDEQRLLRILDEQTEDLDLHEFYENDFRLAHEICALGGNLILQMAYNSQVKLSRRLLELGLVRGLPYPLDRYKEINKSLIKAVCAGDEERVRNLTRKYREGMEEAFIRSFTVRKTKRS